MDFREGNFLIIDDYQAVREMVKKDLKALGHKGLVMEAESGNDAIHKLQILNPNLPLHFVISDWEMENGNGIEVLKFMKTKERFKNIPFLMLSSVGKKEIVVLAIKAGVTDYLLKPWEKEQLEAKISTCWAKKYK